MVAAYGFSRSPRLSRASAHAFDVPKQLFPDRMSVKARPAQRLVRTGILYYEKEVPVPTDTTYTHLRKNLAGILDEVIDQQEVVIVRRKGARDVALIPASELAGIIETAHLLRSPKNARRLLSALRRAEIGKAQPNDVRDLRREILGGS